MQDDKAIIKIVGGFALLIVLLVVGMHWLEMSREKSYQCVSALE